MPWVDIRVREMDEVAERLEAMTHRRSMKSHTPMDGLPLDDHAQYICVFRHPLDAHFSFRNHVRNLPMRWFDHWYPEDDTEGVAFRRFLDGGAEGFDTDAMPLAHILQHYKAARAVSDRANVKLFHYADMCRDLAGVFARVAEVIGVAHSDDVMARLVAAAGFDNMKAERRTLCAVGREGVFQVGPGVLSTSGTSGQWQGKLTQGGTGRL